MNLKNSHHPYAMATILLWSLAFPFTRLALEQFSASTLGFLRYLVASAALIPIAILTKTCPPKLKDALWFAAAGCFGFFLYMIAFNRGNAQVTSATASVVIATVPVITALLARFVYREKLRAHQWCAIAIEFAGVIVLTLMGGAFSLNAGLIWLLLAALSLSIYNLLQRKLARDYTSLQTSTYSIFLGTLMLAVFAPEAFRQAAGARPAHWLYLIVLGVGCSAIAYVSWTAAFARAEKTSQVSNYMFVTPFLTTLISFLLTGETPDSATLIGGGIILLGALIFNFYDKLPRRRRAAE